MGNSSNGRIAGAMKWHVYRYPQKPNTRMVLGSILTKPDDLESSLNYGSDFEPVPPEKREDQTEAMRRVITSELTRNSGGRLKAVLPVNPAVSAGGGVEGASSSSLTTTIEALGVHAEIIVPDTAKEYINKALSLPKVVEYVRQGLFSKSLYLIVGVASCKKLTMNDTSSRETKLSADVDINVSLAGVETGAGVSNGKGASAASGLDVEGACDFAYRIREFTYSKWSRRITGKDDFVDGAMFSKDSTNGKPVLTNAERQELFDEIPVFDDFESEDEDLGFSLPIDSSAI